MPARRSGFSLIELLVVISIIAVLAGMLLPAVGLVKASAQTVNCASNLRQFGLAFSVYVSDNNHLWPTGDWNNLIQSYVNEEGSIGVVGGVPATYRMARCVSAPTFTKIGVPLNATYAYTGHYYNSASFSVPYYFAWSADWMTPTAMKRGAANSQIARPSEKCVLCESWDDSNPGVGNSCWGKSQLCAETIVRIHRLGSNVLLADGHVQFVNMPAFTLFTPKNLAGDNMWYPYKNAASNFLK